jgi:hypothetical protein
VPASFGDAEGDDTGADGDDTGADGDRDFSSEGVTDGKALGMSDGVIVCKNDGDGDSMLDGKKTERWYRCSQE